MSSLPLQARLAALLKKYPGQRFAKGELEDKARAKMGVTAETVGRRLRVLHEATTVEEARAKTPEHSSAHKLAEGGRFLVEYRGKNHSFYYYEPPATRQVRRLSIVGGKAIEVYETVST